MHDTLGPPSPICIVLSPQFLLVQRRDESVNNGTTWILNLGKLNEMEEACEHSNWFPIKISLSSRYIN